MIKYLLFFLIPFSIISCSQKPPKSDYKVEKDKAHKFSFYSKNTSDSFVISVSLPYDYNEQSEKKFPVVYLLDANLYFDIIATTLNKYSEVGLVPPVILIGVGYRDFPTMDSLRNRDYTYPVAIPEYEMTVSGGAHKFLLFLTGELIPAIDKQYHTNESRRILMGHSLGGYFAVYSFAESLAGMTGGFHDYIAASPSLHYNRYWLLSQLEQKHMAQDSQQKKLYITYGGLEDSENATDSTVMKLADLTRKLKTKFAAEHFSSKNYKIDIYSNLGHMDTQIPTFVKGLQWALNKDIQ